MPDSPVSLSLASKAALPAVGLLPPPIFFKTSWAAEDLPPPTRPAMHPPPPPHTYFDQSLGGGEILPPAAAPSMAPAAATWQGGPDIVLLDFGSNDIIGEMDLNTQTRANLQQIIETFAAQNGNVVILIAKP